MLSGAKILTILALATVAQCQDISGSGKTTRYWDCCKPSCSWPGKASLATSPVRSLSFPRNSVADPNEKSGCEDGGTAFTDPTQQPFQDPSDPNLAYGFAAVRLAGQGEDKSCCACYELTFTSGPVVGKRMIVQSTNTGGDLGDNHFDLQLPGGGVGIFNGCSKQYSSPTDGWGQRYGGISSVEECANLPAELQPGCQFRFGWFAGADNPNVDFKQVTCPPALTDRSGCIRADDSAGTSASSTAPATTSDNADLATSQNNFVLTPLPAESQPQPEPQPELQPEVQPQPQPQPELQPQLELQPEGQPESQPPVLSNDADNQELLSIMMRKCQESEQQCVASGKPQGDCANRLRDCNSKSEEMTAQLAKLPATVFGV